ncbi:MAG: hypothetical protein F4124_00595 [Acidimicrobiia bacterium]|nr:hypothetical protein [Acidimicrobiia bacterium]MXZ85329.1 hypothetical protein [Acidimicrobiia bacterium]MYB10273.1 hypothetical protein [Acidimicrobiia bacterium]MYB73124.1 hypothetical protein [Acidimicrobiia bacterium]MYG58591.1 hypothetical protein [Acidimicrobiia bacterium]
MTIETRPEDQETQEGKNKILGFFGKSKKRVAAAAGAVVLTIALVAGACASGESGEGAGHEGGREGAGEHSGSGEGGGMGEAAEAGHGGEAGRGEAAEGGNVTLLTPDQTYDETIGGARLQLAFDPAANAFVGTAENTTNQTLTRVRVEVHLSNGTELGPTTPTDLPPGQSLRLTLPSTAAPFDTWSAHVEVGSGEAGEGSGGGEGSEGSRGEGSEGAGHEGSGGEGRGEGPEGTETGREAAGPGSATYLTSTGVSRGVKSSQVLDIGDSYAGNLNDLELAITYDEQNDRFLARVKNEAAVPICNTSVKVVADGQAGSQSVLIPALDVAGRADFTVEAPQSRFNTWQAETETFTCTSVASHPGEGAEGGSGETGGEGPGHESGGEGAGHEGGGSEGGGEGGEETSPSTPISQPVSGTFNNLDYRVAYDRATNSFMATVTNNTSQTVCASRLEIHMGAQGQVIELGPTIGVDLRPGESIDVVLSADPVVPDTYSIHPESSPCS